MPDEKSGNLHANAKLSRKGYERELARLHVEFVKLQQWVVGDFRTLPRRHHGDSSACFSLTIGMRPPRGWRRLKHGSCGLASGKLPVQAGYEQSALTEYIARP